ncbi:MAG: Appr-1-p processing protein, partial [bacterium]
RDRSRGSSIRLMPGVSEEAATFLNKNLETKEALVRVSALIEGFETPYGLELLATVYWIAQEKPETKEDVQFAIEGVHGWSAYKKKSFKPAHIKAAWRRLKEEGWF